MNNTDAPQVATGHTVGGAIRAARRARDWSQAHLAGLLGVRTAAVSDWETGKHTPTAGNLTDLARFFGVSEAELRYGITPASTVGDAADVALPTDDGEPHGPEYYRGLQRGLMSTMEFVARSLRESIAAHDRAIAMQQEIIENTTPVARPAKVSKGGAPAKRPAAAPEKRRRPG